MGNAAVIYQNNPPNVIVASFMVKKALVKGRGNVYDHLLGNVLNNHIIYPQVVIQCG